MTYDEAKEVLQGLRAITRDGGLDNIYDDRRYIYWRYGRTVELEGVFTCQELEAIVTYVKGTPRHGE